MRSVHRAPLLLGAVAAVVGLAGCGSSGSLLNTAAADQLTSELNQASRALSEYDCLEAYSALTAFRDDVGQLQGVNATLVSSLDQGESTVASLANQRCPTGASTTTTSTPTTTRTKTVASTTTTAPPVPTTVTVTTSGTTGDTGDTGDTGNTGNSGDTGDTGNTGNTGTPTPTPPTPAPPPNSGGGGLNTGAAGAGTAGAGQ